MMHHVLRFPLCWLILLFLLLPSFFCSDSPFDPDTDLGSDILNDKDPLFTTMNAKLCNDTLVQKSGYSFLDRTDTVISGLGRPPIAVIGSWQNEHAFAYFQFKASTIQEWLTTISENQYTLLSFCCNFTNDNENGDPAENICVELGYYDTLAKSKNSLLDTNQFVEINNYTFNGAASAARKIVITPGHIIDTVPVTLLASKRYRSGYLHSITQEFIPTDTLLDTIAKLHPFIKDTIIIDTVVGAPLDTSYIIGIITTVFDTIVDTITSVKDTAVYDSLAGLQSLIKPGQKIYASSSDSFTTGNTTVFHDTVITVVDTAVARDVKKTVTHLINGSDTVDIIRYDTMRIVTVISQDTVIQHAVKSPKISLFAQAYDKNKWGRDTSLCLYLRLDPAKSNSLLYLKDVSLSVRYFNPVKKDTVTQTLPPFYHDVSVFESNAAPLDTTMLSSSGAGRYAVMEIDLQPVWESMKDSTGQIRYRNIPRALLTLYPDTVLLHKSAGGTIGIFYALKSQKTTGIEDMTRYKSKFSIAASVKNLEIPINTFLIEMVYDGVNNLPRTGYLYVWTSLYHNKTGQLTTAGDMHFSHIRWDKPSGGLPINYIISNSN